MRHIYVLTDLTYHPLGFLYLCKNFTASMEQKDFSRYIFPASLLGRWSIAMTGFFLLFLLVHNILIFTGQRGGNTFLSNPLLAVFLLGASFSAIASFVAGTLAIIKDKERSVFVILCSLIGLMVLAGVLGILLMQ